MYILLKKRGKRTEIRLKSCIELWRHLANLSAVFLTKKFDGDNVEEGRKVRMENPPKFIHKLNKQQIEQWHQNSSELFLAKKFGWRHYLNMHVDGLALTVWYSCFFAVFRGKCG